MNKKELEKKAKQEILNYKDTDMIEHVGVFLFENYDGFSDLQNAKDFVCAINNTFEKHSQAFYFLNPEVSNKYHTIADSAREEDMTKNIELLKKFAKILTLNQKLSEKAPSYTSFTDVVVKESKKNAKLFYNLDKIKVKNIDKFLSLGNFKDENKSIYNGGFKKFKGLDVSDNLSGDIEYKLRPDTIMHYLLERCEKDQYKEVINAIIDYKITLKTLYQSELMLNALNKIPNDIKKVDFEELEKLPENVLNKGINKKRRTLKA